MVREKIDILASVSFWPLLIIEFVCPNTCFSRTTYSLRYNVKSELGLFQLQGGGVFSDYSLQCVQKKAITIHVFAEKINSSMGNI